MASRPFFSPGFPVPPAANPSHSGHLIYSLEIIYIIPFHPQKDTLQEQPRSNRSPLADGETWMQGLMACAETPSTPAHGESRGQDAGTRQHAGSGTDCYLTRPAAKGTLMLRGGDGVPMDLALSGISLWFSTRWMPGSVVLGFKTHCSEAWLGQEEGLALSTDHGSRLQLSPPSSPTLTPPCACPVHMPRGLLRECPDPRQWGSSPLPPSFAPGEMQSHHLHLSRRIYRLVCSLWSD